MSASAGLHGDGKTIADAIRTRMKNELGITVSVGVSYNKIFAKLGSDYKKPDATTVISRENFKDIVWKLPAGDLLYVGRATQKKFAGWCIHTIGDIAKMDPNMLRYKLGKWGDVLYSFANGYDDSPVTVMGEEAMIKSIGNSITTPRDLVDDEDVKMIFYVLCESVAMRLREHGFRCRVVQIHVRDVDLFTFERQHKLSSSTNLAAEIHKAAMELFRNNYTWSKPIPQHRSAGRGAHTRRR